jgi:hypothetical protein
MAGLIYDTCEEGYEYSKLYWNLRRLYFYIENDACRLVGYGMRCRKGLPVSNCIAESAVNLVRKRVVNARAYRKVATPYLYATNSPDLQSSP